MTWVHDPILAVDTETTGVDPAEDRIVEMAAVRLDHGEITLSWSTIVDPGVEIPDQAANIHGITTQRAQTEGVLPVDALRHLGELIAGHDGPVVIYNARFDWPLLITEADRHGLIWPDALLLDPLVLDKHLDPYRRGSRKLIDTAGHYGVTLTVDDAHGAAADALAAARITEAMVRNTPAMAATTLEALQVWQQRWHDDQAASFADYMRRARDPQFTKQLGWPVPSGVAA